MTPDEYDRARRLLMRRDPILAPIIRHHRDRRLIDAPPVDPFSALVRTIVGQQLSTKAAATIHRRLLDLCRPEWPRRKPSKRSTTTQLRQAGLSRQKISYLRDLASEGRERRAARWNVCRRDRRRGDRGHRQGEGPGPLVGGDVPHVPAAAGPTSCPSTTSASSPRSSACTGCARSPRPRASARSATPGARTAPWRAGICGAVSKTLQIESKTAVVRRVKRTK